MITGKYLIELGIKPSKFFKETMEFANSGDYNDEEIINFHELILPKEKVYVSHEEPIFYHRNIKADSKLEQENIDSVIKQMDIVMKTPTIITGAIMPDACPVGENQIPVGGIAVAKNAIHPSFHSADICCSVMSTNLGKIDPKLVLDASFSTTHFGTGGRKEHGGWSNLLYDNKSLTERIQNNFFTSDYIEKAAMHLGTQGDGNHFLFVGISKNTGDTHIVTHHGSRGFGAGVYKKGMSVAKKLTGKNQVNPWIPFDEVEGVMYWDALQIIRDWTKLNHEAIHNRILNKLKTPYIDRFWNEHNFVFKEGDLFYHAKGATPLEDKFVPDSVNGLRLIPLNMSQPVLVVKGNKTENNLGFAPHGAGRNLSRTAHKKLHLNKTNEEIFAHETKNLDIRFFSRNIDISELPSAYKNAENVKQQIIDFNLGEIIDEIEPYGCIMAGEMKFNRQWKKNKK